MLHLIYSDLDLLLTESCNGLGWLKDHPVPTSQPWAGTAPSPVQPGLEHCQGWNTQSVSGQAVPVPHPPHREQFHQFFWVFSLFLACWLSRSPVGWQGPRGASVSGAASGGAARCCEEVLCRGEQLHLRGDVCCHPGGNSIFVLRLFSEVTENLKSPFTAGNVCQHLMSVFKS